MNSKLLKKLSLFMVIVMLTTSVDIRVFAGMMPKGTLLKGIESDSYINEHKELAEISVDIPEKAIIGTSFEKTISISNTETISKIIATFNGEEIEVDKDNKISFTITELGQNVLNIKVYEDENIYVEKIYYIEGIAELEESTEEITELETEELPSMMLFGAFTPQISISNPLTDGIITEPTDIIGTADGTGVLKYTLEYAAAGDVFIDKPTPAQKAEIDKSYIVINEILNPVSNGVLGTFDTTKLSNGFYSLRLVAHATDGTKQSTDITVSVEGNMKNGHFSTEFLDMDIPVMNFPLSVTRGYDSRTKDVDGDFGFGWNLSMAKATLTESGVPGNGWVEKSKSGSWGMRIYYLEGTYKHEISVDWGNGRVEKFTMKTNPEQQAAARMQWIDGINYVAQGKSKSKLKSVWSKPLLYNGGGIYDYDFNTYNPKKYILTTQDGSEYLFDDKNGIEEIKDTKGNKITFDKKGVYHSDGNSILFERNSDDRITKISSSSGKEASYEYNSNGELVKFTATTGETTEYLYGDNHYLEEIIDPRGVTVSRNQYDDNGRLVAVIDANGNTIKLDTDIGNKRDTLTDRLGNTTVFEYDNKGNIITVTDALGNVTRYTYDTANNKTSMIDALGNTTKYEYSDDGKLISLTNAHGYQVKNTYNTKGNLTAVNGFGFQQAGFLYDAYGQTTQAKDALANTTDYKYQEDGRLISITDKIGVKNDFVYDEKGNVISTTDANGAIATFTYDEEGNALSKTLTRTSVDGKIETLTENYQYDIADNVSKIIYHDGTFLSLEYDAINNMTATTDSENRRTTYEYDLFGNLLKVSYFDNTFETFEYDKENRNIKATDRYGQAVQMTYDSIGNLKTKTFQNGAKETFEYDAKHRLISQTSVSGGTTTYAYDAIDRNTYIVDALGNKTEFTYNTLSQLSEVKDPRGNVTKFIYDKNGNRTKTTLANTFYVSATYDARGRMITQTDQNLYLSKYAYDSGDRLVSVTDPLANVWKYDYNETNELTAVTDPKGNKTSYEYDEMGRIVKTTNAKGQTATTAYDARGNTLKTVDYAGIETNISYDSQDRAIKISTGTIVKEITYNNANLPTKVTQNGKATSYIYNAYNQLESVVDENAKAISYEYDLAGRITKVKTPYGDTENEYDVLNRLISVTDKDSTKTNYSYDLNGNLETVKYSNGMTTTYYYNQVNALIGEKITDKTDALVHEYKYTVGKAGERLTVIETGGRTVTYTYDKLYRLTKELVKEGAVTDTTSYTYDVLSNRLSKNQNSKITNYTYNELNQLLTENSVVDGNYTYSYDLNGNRIKKVSGTETSTFIFNELNQLTRATVQKGVNANVEEYKYDWQGNRIQKSSELETTNYLVDINNWIAHVVAEYDELNKLEAYYTRGNDTLISQVRGTEKSYYLYDGHGSVRMLANENNFVTDKYTYDAYGVTTLKTGVTENNYLYAGEQFDKGTELYYLRTRYMEPSTGTFISMDTYQGNMSDPQSLHKYMYANASPVMFKDPTGCFSLSEISATTGIQGILNSMSRIKIGELLLWARRILGGVQLIMAVNNAYISFLGGDIIGFIEAILSGILGVAAIIGICDSSIIMQVLTKALAGVGAVGNVSKFIDAYNEEDIDGMVTAAVGFVVDLLVLFSACFTAETLVATENGYKRIDEIEVGDKVWAYNIETSETELKEVKEVFVKEVNELVYIKTLENEEDIKTTTTHPFYVKDKGWVAAGDLAVGDEFYQLDGTSDFVTELEIVEFNETVLVYNFTVEDFHSYFVSDGDVLVHNSKYKRDNKQVDAAANKLKMDKTTRKEFGEYIEYLKRGEGKRGDVNFSFKELIEIGKEFLGLD